MILHLFLCRLALRCFLFQSSFFPEVNLQKPLPASVHYCFLHSYSNSNVMPRWSSRFSGICEIWFFLTVFTDTCSEAPFFFSIINSPLHSFFSFSSYFFHNSILLFWQIFVFLCLLQIHGIHRTASWLFSFF